MKNYILLIWVALLFGACSSKQDFDFEGFEEKDQIYSTKKAKNLSIQEAVSQIEPYQVIFVGDHHNTKKTHEFFNDILKELIQKGYKIHLANEWFYPTHNTMLKEYVEDKFDSDELKKKRDWDKFTKFDWNLSKMLYETVKDSKGELYGINIPRDFRKHISKKEIKDMTKEEKEFFDSLDLNVNAHQKLVSPYLKHCEKAPNSKACEERMYRVQVAWDSYMARETYKLSKEVLKTSKDKLIVFAGAFHIDYDLGIPLRFARLSNIPYTTITNYEIYKDEDIKLHNNLGDIVYIYGK